MKKTDLKIGYVVEIREGREGKLYMVMPNDNVDYDLVISNTKSWMMLKHFNNDLTSKFFKEHDIMEVYGFTNYPTDATIVSTKHRKLLWKRDETKKMTVAEIEDILGYKIEVVSES